MRRSQPATDEAILCLQELFSQECFRGETPVGAPLVGEGQAAHELQSPDEERSRDEVQALPGLRAA
jgi:hypothetical protein